MFKKLRESAKNLLILATVALAGYGVKCLQEPVVEEPTIIVQQIENKVDLAKVAQNAIGATAKLYGEDPYGGFTGSAYFISPKVAITAGHCVDGATSIRLEMYNGGKELRPDRWLHDNIHDVGILLFDNPQNVPCLPVRTTPVKLGEEVMLIGCPFGLPDIVTWGRVSNPGTDFLLDHWKGELFVVDAWAAPGNSGGVVLDAYGNVIGILVGGPNRTGASNGLCVPIHIMIESAKNIAAGD